MSVVQKKKKKEDLKTFNFMVASYFGGIAMILNTRNYKHI